MRFAAVTLALAASCAGASPRVAPSAAPTTAVAAPRVTATTAAAAPGATAPAPARVDVGVPMVGSVAVDAAEAPATLDAARFSLVDGAGHAREVTPVRDGELEPAPTAQHRAVSFVVDYDQAPLAAMCEGPPWSADEALRQADARIARKSLAIPFVTASVAAARREGDCTEHAVLAAALLRCHGHAARLAVGVLVWHARDRWIAGGHMWAERYDHGWHIADATRPEAHGEVAYLRFGALDDEGPAVVFSVASRFRQQAGLRVRVTAR